jgi:hypothetical protein
MSGVEKRIRSRLRPYWRWRWRRERMRGQPSDTALMNFEPAHSIVWVTVRFTAPSFGPSSNAQRDYPSALSSGLNSLRH